MFAPDPVTLLGASEAGLLAPGPEGVLMKGALTVLTSKKTPVGQYAQEAFDYLGRER